MTFRKVYPTIQRALTTYCVPCAMLSALKGKEQKTTQDPVERPSGFTHGASVYMHLLMCPQRTLTRYVFSQKIRLRLREVKQRARGYTAKEEVEQGQGPP